MVNWSWVHNVVHIARTLWPIAQQPPDRAVNRKIHPKSLLIQELTLRSNLTSYSGPQTGRSLPPFNDWFLLTTKGAFSTGLLPSKSITLNWEKFEIELEIGSSINRIIFISMLHKWNNYSNLIMITTLKLICFITYQYVKREPFTLRLLTSNPTSGQAILNSLRLNRQIKM